VIAADHRLVALIAAIVGGAAALAIWSFLRWPSAAPSTFGGALVHGILAFGTLQVVGSGLGIVSDRSDEAVGFALIVLVLPALTYAFLASLWVLRLFAALVKGAR
jgi:hypothetical protein